MHIPRGGALPQQFAVDARGMQPNHGQGSPLAKKRRTWGRGPAQNFLDTWGLQKSTLGWNLDVEWPHSSFWGGRGGGPGSGHDEAGCKRVGPPIFAGRSAVRMPRRPLREPAPPASSARGGRRSWARRVALIFRDPSAALAERERARRGCWSVEAPTCRFGARLPQPGAAQRSGAAGKNSQNRAACALQLCTVWRRWPVACAGSACVHVCSWPWKCAFRACFPQLRVPQSCCGAGK
jgi:hypothetical protein